MPFSYLERPHALQAVIDARYGKLAQKALSEWGVDGVNGPYQLASFNEHLIILAIIEARLKLGERSFYILEAGAGLFTWGRYLAKFLTEQFQDPRFRQYEDFRCYVVCVSGEAHGETLESIVQDPFFVQEMQKKLDKRREIIKGVLEENIALRSQITRVLTNEYCTLYEFGHVKLENIQSILPQRLCEVGAPVLSENLLDTFDFVVSSSTLQHLVDGAGTVVQMLDMLKIDGIAAFHGFNANIDYPENLKEEHKPHVCLEILSNLRMPFFAADDFQRYPTCFVQKNISGPVNLPLQYAAEQKLDQKDSRATLTPTKGFSSVKLRYCSARNTEHFVTTLDGMHFYNMLTKLSLKVTPLASDNPYANLMKHQQKEMYLDLANAFRVESARIRESSLLLPSRFPQADTAVVPESLDRVLGLPLDLK